MDSAVIAVNRPEPMSRCSIEPSPIGAPVRRVDMVSQNHRSPPCRVTVRTGVCPTTWTMPGAGGGDELAAGPPTPG